LSSPKVLQIFVSSPSDVPDEREICRKVVAELQRDKLRAKSLQISPFFWEDDLVPGVGADAQAVVNESLAAANDEPVAFRIVVCMLSTRLGTKTRFALSGTAEEVVRSLLDATAEGGRLLLYVSDRPVAPSKIDTAQLNGVRRFLEAFTLVGGLYSPITSKEQFEAALRQHLREAVDACSRIAADKHDHRPHAPLPFELRDNLKDHARSLTAELDRLALLASNNLRDCLALLTASAKLWMDMSSAAPRGDAKAVQRQLSDFLSDVEQRYRYTPLASGIAALRAAKVYIAFGGVLTAELQPLRLEIIDAATRLLEQLRPLIDAVVSFSNNVIVDWPSAIFPLQEGSVLAVIRSDAEPLRALESEVQALDRVLTLVAPADAAGSK
jgi:hypothetical protein